MNAKLIFWKALYQLDRGIHSQAQENLARAIAVAKDERDLVTLAGALCCLGDFLFQLGEHERAKAVLQELLSYGFEGDLFDHELRRARELLQGPEKQGPEKGSP